MFQVINLASTLLTEHYEPSLFTYFYETNPWGMWVCEESHHIIGFAIGLAFTDHIGRIVMIAVHPPHQRQKIGSTLLAQLLGEFREKDLTIVELEVKTTNQKAISFYKEHQFTIVERFPHFYQNGEDAYLMRLKVSPHGDC
jgi:ribosomal protein S18 acetylase RimI-like enzyme